MIMIMIQAPVVQMKITHYMVHNANVIGLLRDMWKNAKETSK